MMRACNCDLLTFNSAWLRISCLIAGSLEGYGTRVMDACGSLILLEEPDVLVIGRDTALFDLNGIGLATS